MNITGTKFELQDSFTSDLCNVNFKRIHAYMVLVNHTWATPNSSEVVVPTVGDIMRTADRLVYDAIKSFDKIKDGKCVEVATGGFSVGWFIWGDIVETFIKFDIA